MAYDASLRGGGTGGRFSEADRSELTRLEGLRQPTDWDRGRLAAFRLTATDPDDAGRVQALTDRWGSR
jgi:hypothetical protein